ncbi:MAG: Bug family tripartite tricarboxylate transporter substrate binding protein, partial [Betaproteobacteria bacterium]
PFDVNKDFVPVTLLAKVPNLFCIHPDVPAKDFKEFVAYAKKNPGKLDYGSAGNASAGHLAMEYLKMVTDTFIVHVPYRGTGPQLTDLLAGRLQAASVGAAAVIQFVRTGRLRCIATGTLQRLPQLPDVPTVAEQGWPGFEMTQWYGILGPANLPQAAVEVLAAASTSAVKQPATNEKFSTDAVIGVGGGPAEFARFIAQEQQRWKPVVDRARIKPD